MPKSVDPGRVTALQLRVCVILKYWIDNHGDEYRLLIIIIHFTNITIDLMMTWPPKLNNLLIPTSVMLAMVRCPYYY